MRNPILYFHCPLVLKTIVFSEIDNFQEFINLPESKICAKSYFEKELKPVLLALDKTDNSNVWQIVFSGLTLEFLKKVRPDFLQKIEGFRAIGKVEVKRSTYVPLPKRMLENKKVLGKQKSASGDLMEKAFEAVPFESDHFKKAMPLNHLQENAMEQWMELFEKSLMLRENKDFLSLADLCLFQNMITDRSARLQLKVDVADGQSAFDFFINYMNILQGLGKRI